MWAIPKVALRIKIQIHTQLWSCRVSSFREGLEKFKIVFKSQTISQVPPGNFGPMPALMCLLLAPCSAQKRKKSTSLRKIEIFNCQRTQTTGTKNNNSCSTEISFCQSTKEIQGFRKKSKNLEYLRVLKKNVEDYQRSRNYLGMGGGNSHHCLNTIKSFYLHCYHY